MAKSSNKKGPTEEIQPPPEVLNALYRDLRVDDRVRIVKLPWYADIPGYIFPDCTRRLYRKLIARGRALRVFEIDEYGFPWVRCRFRMKNGRWEHHWLMIDDDSWVRVKRRG
jgi:hypothetical protein